MQIEIPAGAAELDAVDARPRTSLILLPLMMVLLGILGWAVGNRMSAMLTAQGFKPRTRPVDEAFYREAKAFYDENAIDQGVVRLPAGQVGYFLAQQWAYIPELRLKADTRYTLWVASTDVPHGFTLRDQGLNLLVIPGTAYQVVLQFEEPGPYAVSCTEYCGLGHETMFGRIIVEP